MSVTVIILVQTGRLETILLVNKCVWPMRCGVKYSGQKVDDIFELYYP